MERGRVILAAAVIILVAGCGTSEPLQQQRRTLTFDAGSPIVDFDAVPGQGDAGPQLHLTWGVIPASFVRTYRIDGRQSIIRSDISVEPVESGQGASHSRIDTVFYASDRDRELYDYRLFQRSIDLAPGDYEVSIRVEDGTTGSATRRVARVTIPQGDAGPPACHLQLFRAPDTDRPVVSFHVAGDAPWLDVATESWGDAAPMQLAIVRIPSDTTVAEPPFGLGRTRVALSVRGVAEEDTDTVQVLSWVQGEEARRQVLRIQPPEAGLYRAVCLRDGEPLAVREFAVRQPGFPRVDRLSVMVDALEYLATDREMRYLREAHTDVELKLRFDAFWAQRAPNRQSAMRLLTHYYSRVEEANLLFSGVKEGWKTDRGMIYIMRGPPLFRERQIEHETWFYTYSDVNPADVFRFDRIIINGVDAVSRNVVLDRHPVYDYEWRRLLDRWRRGDVL